MEMIIPIMLIALAVILWRTNGRDQYQLMSILQSSLALIVFWLIGQDVTSENGLLLFGILSSIWFLHFVLSRFWKKKGFYWPLIFILLTSGLFFLMGDEVFVIYDFSVQITALPLILLPILGAAVEPIADIKEKVLGDFFRIDFKNRRGISRAVYVFLFGVLLFLAHFTGSYIGIALVTLGFGVSLLYLKKSGAVWNMFLGLIAISSIGYFANLGQIESSNLILGRVMEGLFFGAFISLLVNTLGRAKKNSNVATILSWFLMIVLPAGILMIGTQNINFGGTDAFIGVMMGFALTAFLGINTRKNSSLLAIYMAIGIALIPMTINKEAEAMTTISLSTDDASKEEQPKDIFEAAGQTIDLTGNFSIQDENSQLTFELGPNGGRTKGAFKSFDGTFKFGENNALSVTLPVKELTTFNSYRDESLMDDTYFNEEKFPNMTFEANSLEKSSDLYIAKGKFTMLGVTLDQVVEMKYLGKTGVNNAPVFIGRSKIDRTKYGMKSDPKEGDIVDFLFKVELKDQK